MFEEMKENSPVFDVVHMPNILHEHVSVELSENSKSAFLKAQPKQGFIGLAELLPEENRVIIHLVPAFNNHDGLAKIDKDGQPLPISNQFTGVPLGTLNAGFTGALPLHVSIAQSLGIGHKAGVNGLMLGFGIWKSGCGLKFVNTLPPREGRIPNEVIYTQDSQSGLWSAYFIDMKRDVHQIDLESDESLKEFQAELSQYSPKSIPDSLRFKISNALQEDSKYQNETLEQISYVKNRSASMNSHSIKYAPWYRKYFSERTGHQGSHSADLIREIPSPILNKLLQAIIDELSLPQALDIYDSPIIPDGPDGLKWHFLAEKEARMNLILHSNDIAFIKKLFENGEDINLEYGGISLLQAAIKGENYPLIKLLLAQKVQKMSTTDLMLEVIGYLVTEKSKHEVIHEMKSNLSELCHDFDNDNFNSALASSEKWLNNNIKDYKEFEELIQKKQLPLTILRKNKESLLHFTARNGQSEILSGLLAKDASYQILNARDANHNSVLHVAVKQPNSLIEILPYLKPDELFEIVKSKNKLGKSVLMEACDSLLSFKMLIDKLDSEKLKLLVNDKDFKENSLLSYAISTQNQAAIQVILEYMKPEVLFALLSENNAALFFEAIEYTNDYILKSIIDKLSDTELLELSKITNKDDFNFLQLRLSSPKDNHIILTSILEKLPLEKRFNLLATQNKGKTFDGCLNALSYCHSTQLLSIVLHSLPDADRFKALTTPINQKGQSLLDIIKTDTDKMKTVMACLSQSDKEKVLKLTKPKASEPPKPAFKQAKKLSLSASKQTFSNPGDGFGDDIFGDLI
ncbi:hypothetical protein L3V82_09260 [Thiotrichales bacterium 19S3-7]|nr:hypothetical protein [Thiotrichales bacterium 19S3-7]MCF6802347.1 hypothetical protein [Thiotrichales bacterium 19S3-11]